MNVYLATCKYDDEIMIYAKNKSEAKRLAENIYNRILNSVYAKIEVSNMFEHEQNEDNI